MLPWFCSCFTTKLTEHRNLFQLPVQLKLCASTNAAYNHSTIFLVAHVLPLTFEDCFVVTWYKAGTLTDLSHSHILFFSLSVEETVKMHHQSVPSKLLLFHFSFFSAFLCYILWDICWSNFWTLEHVTASPQPSKLRILSSTLRISRQTG